MRDVRELEARTKASAEWAAKPSGGDEAGGPTHARVGELRRVLATRDAELIAVQTERDELQEQYLKQSDTLLTLQHGALAAKQVEYERDDMRQMLKDKHAEIAALQHEMLRGDQRPQGGSRGMMDPVATDSLSAHMTIALRDLTTEKNAEIVELQKLIMNKEATLATQRTEMDRIITQRTAMQAELVSARRMAESGQHDRAAALSELDRHREQLKASQSETSQLQVSEMAMTYELEEHRRKAHEAATTLCKDCQTTQRALQDKEKAYMELERLLHTHRSTEDVVRQAASQSEAEAERRYLLLECDMETLRRDLMESQSSLVTTTERLRESLGEIAALQQSHRVAASASVQLPETETRLSHAEAQLRAALQKLHGAEEEKGDLERMVETLKDEAAAQQRRRSLGMMGDEGLVEECDKLRAELEAAASEQQRLMRMVLNGVDSAMATGASPSRSTPGTNAAKKVRRKSLVPAEAATATPVSNSVGARPPG